MNLKVIDSVLDSVFCILDDFLGISKPLLGFASDLVVDAPGLLLLVSNQFPGFFLNFASEVLDSTFDLIFVHGDFLESERIASQASHLVARYLRLIDYRELICALAYIVGRTLISIKAIRDASSGTVLQRSFASLAN